MCPPENLAIHPLRLAAFTSLALAGSVLAAQQLPQASPTTSFLPAEELQAAGSAIAFGSHATVRCFDWEGDRDLDLVVGDGDGRIWRVANVPNRVSGAEFVGRQRITAGDRTNWGDSYTGVVLHDLNGDRLPDLIVAHSHTLVSIHNNVGTRTEPKFESHCIEVTVQGGCQGRLDVADWDGDGHSDLITGSFDGALQWHRNVGTGRVPKFGPGESFCGIRLAYNAHPRIFDFDRDGVLDLLLGVNWGTVSLYRNIGSTTEPKLGEGKPLCWAANGKGLNLREQNGDDTTPELADLNGDGVLDLISGGKNGKLFVMHGVGVMDRVASLRQLLAAGAGDCVSYFERDEAARTSAFGVLQALEADLAAKLLNVDQREHLFLQLTKLAADHSELLARRKHDLAVAPHAPMLAAQFWVAAKSTLPDTPRGRERVAEALQFTKGYRRLLIDLGVVFYDNDTATERQLTLMHQLLTALPRPCWDVELISVADWLGEGRHVHQVRARTAINIFGMNLGVPENSFPQDSPRPGITDVYLICLAHEIAHNMLDTVGRRVRPDLFERKFEGLAFGAGEDVVYRSPRSKGIDVAATKAKFRAAGYWDGDDRSWRDAWRSYFAGKERFDRAYARGNVQFFLDAPQEAFSTLANQFCTDSELMLEFAKVRWDAGHRSTVHQFLLIADYFSDNSNRVPFYVLPRGGALRVNTAELTRDARGRIRTLSTGLAEATFGYDSVGDAIVKDFTYRLKSK